MYRLKITNGHTKRMWISKVLTQNKLDVLTWYTRTYSKFTITRLDRNLGETSDRRNGERSKSKQDLALPLRTTTARLDNESVYKRLEKEPRDTHPPPLPCRQSIIPILWDPSPLLNIPHPTSELSITVLSSTLQVSLLYVLLVGLDSSSDQTWQPSHKAILSGLLIYIFYAEPAELG